VHASCDIDLEKTITMRPMSFRFLPALAAALALCQGARAETFLLAPGSDLVEALGMARAAYEDTLTDIARRAGLGYDDMLRANPGTDPWLPGRDAEVVLPTRYILPTGTRRGLLVNIAEFRLYYFMSIAGQPAVATFPISIGRMDWHTPLGMHRILSKQKQPTWYPPESIRAEHAADGDILPKVVPPGPQNPLGDYAMRLSQSGYLIHGTNKPVGIGMQVTHGCIRMYPEDIEWLFSQVPVGSPVQIVNEPYKFGWAEDGLYLEVHPLLEGDRQSEDHGMTQITQLYVRATAERPARVDWTVVEQAYREKLGLPVRVGAAALTADAGEPSPVLVAGREAVGAQTPRGSEKYPKK
jgi:L,D-transpeptidase ErfK/SrfK